MTTITEETPAKVFKHILEYRCLPDYGPIETAKKYMDALGLRDYVFYCKEFLGADCIAAWAARNESLIRELTKSQIGYCGERMDGKKINYRSEGKIVARLCGIQEDNKGESYLTTPMYIYNALNDSIREAIPLSRFIAKANELVNK